MKIVNHRISEAEDFEYLPSPNFDLRPKSEDISLLVIHNISLPPGEFGGTFVEDFFLNRLDSSKDPFFEEIQDLHVASHLYIKRSGHIVQFVDFDKRAWHAGKSTFKGRETCNDFSIGIELEGTDDQPYTPEQYKKLTQVTLCLIKNYPKIKSDHIVGHSDVAPGRKTDPGPSFDWDYYLQQIEELK